MTILYFSSTGNCLYLAKRIGGEVISIPDCKKGSVYYFEDDRVGVVFPVYGLCVPPFIEEFLENTEITTEYFFAIATYGFFPGAVCRQVGQIQTKNGRGFDYANRLKMAENCVTFSDMAKQKGDSDKQQKCIAEILNDLSSEKKMIRSDSLFKRFMTRNHLKDYEFPIGVGITESIRINDACIGCETCVRLCPMENITIINNRPLFGNNCVSCGACLQHCPTNAIHHEKEKSSARYRNPHIDINELMYR